MKVERRRSPGTRLSAQVRRPVEVDPFLLNVRKGYGIIVLPDLSSPSVNHSECKRSIAKVG